MKDKNKITNNLTINSRTHKRRTQNIPPALYMRYRQLYNKIAKWSNPNILHI